MKKMNKVPTGTKAPKGQMHSLPTKGDQPFLTIGMAHYEDFHGVYFTIQAIRLAHPEYMEHIEFVVIDNSPNTEHSKMIVGLLNNLRGLVANVKYVEMTDPVGTSPSRNRIFKEATGEFVLVMDCHVLLAPEALPALFDYYLDNPTTDDLISGPMLYDNMAQLATHFDDNWRGEMWGTWGAAWRCSCGSLDPAATFALMEVDGHIAGRKLELGLTPTSQCGVCGKQHPVMGWAGHERPLVMLGYERLGFDSNGPAFDIPGQGLGLFTTRRSSWLGFHPESRGFGGEELYIHGRYRALNRRTLCLPALKWLHRFGRPEGVKYPITRFNKVRNYVLEFTEMGWSLAPVRQHFVDANLMTVEVWNKLVANPSGISEKECDTCNGGTAPDFKTLQDAFNYLFAIPRDLERHMPKLRELAAMCSTVTEFSSRRESTVALLAGGPLTMYSYNMETTAVIDKVVELVKAADLTNLIQQKTTSDKVETLHRTDLLFLDSKHTYAYLLEELHKFGPVVSRFIVLHDTAIYGFRGEDGGNGLLGALTAYMKEVPRWSVIYHTGDQYGLTVLGCLDEDKPKLPGLVTMGINFSKALAGHVMSGLENTTAQQLEARLNACTMCEQRRDEQCTVCGCYVLEKAKMASQGCPLNRWPSLVQLEEVATEDVEVTEYDE